MYLSKPAGIPLKTITINGQSADLDTLGVKNFIEIYSNNPDALDSQEIDKVQARLFLTNTLFLNAASGIKIYS
jgi:hypothetical protein